MNLRRRRRARTLALAAFLLAALTWAYSIFFVTSWTSRTFAQGWGPPGFGQPIAHRRHIQLALGTLLLSNRSFGYAYQSQPAWMLCPAPDLSRTNWQPLFHIAPDPIGASPRKVIVALPLWIPLALTLPPLVLTHARVHRPLNRLRRGVCHRCAYNLNATPPENPCPECGSPRLALPQRQGRPARTAT